MFQSLKPDDPYYPRWLELRRRTRAAWLTLLVGGLGVSVVYGTLEVAFAVPSWAIFCVALPWVGAFAVARARQVHWPCPRCGRPFYSSGITYRPFAVNCLHCRLPEHAAAEDK